MQRPYMGMSARHTHVSAIIHNGHVYIINTIANPSVFGPLNTIANPSAFGSHDSGGVGAIIEAATVPSHCKPFGVRRSREVRQQKIDVD